MRSLSDEYGEAQYSRGEKIIGVGCDRVGVEVRGGSSGGSSAVFREGAVCEAGGIGDSARAETSVGTSWGVRASKGTRRRGDEAVPRTSLGSKSWCPVKGTSCRPQETNRSGGVESS